MSAQYNLPSVYQNNPKIKPVITPRIQLRTIDPALIQLTKSGRNSNGRHYGRVLMRLKNVGAINYRSSRNQQSVQLYRNGRFVRSFRFTNLRAGQNIDFVPTYTGQLYRGE